MFIDAISKEFFTSAKPGDFVTPDVAGSRNNAQGFAPAISKCVDKGTSHARLVSKRIYDGPPNDFLVGVDSSSIRPPG